MKNFNDITYIDAYLHGEMEASERQDFETQLAADEALRKEVAAYRAIFSGLKGIREEKFANDVEKWAAEAREAGKMQQEAGNIRTLPVGGGATIRRMYRTIAVAASLLLVLGLASAWWASRQYSNEKLAVKAYIAPLNDGTMGTGQVPQASELEKQFREAHRLFQAGNYGDAARQFGIFIRALEDTPSAFDDLTRKTYLDNAKWTMLLANFASRHLTEEEFSQQLTTIADDPANEYADKAQALRKDTGSIWRVFAR
jgi:hypothetical protein